ncbi:MAG: Asp-tRNA(Asn)/Glu-tRNA(Gln) amidotransferase subunit GatC [Patescibacteria group bacterium]
MAKLTQKDVEHVARLAKLSLTPQEVEKYLRELSSVINYVSELAKVDTVNTQPTSQTTGLENVARNDIVKSEQALGTRAALSGADRVHNAYFVVEDLLAERSEK